jgi:hypothetical protein
VSKYQTYWVACSHYDLAVSSWPLWFFFGHRFPSCCQTGSSSRELLLLYRVRRRFSPARRLLSTEHLPWGLFPLRDTSLWSPLTTSFPRPVYCSVLSVSHTLDGLLLHRPLRACFIPLPRPGFALQGFSPLPSRLASSTRRALMPFPRFSCHRVATLAPDPPALPTGL